MTTRTDFNVMIPMRDGIRLAADIHRLDKPGKFPVILARTSYGKYSKAAYEQAEYFARQGYVYVNQDVRGRFDSEGEFQVLVNEGHNGYDTIEWPALTRGVVIGPSWHGHYDERKSGISILGSKP